jgi:hypothetical protein
MLQIYLPVKHWIIVGDRLENSANKNSHYSLERKGTEGKGGGTEAHMTELY